MANKNQNKAKNLTAKAESALAKMDFGAAVLLFRLALDANPKSKNAMNGALIAGFCAKRPEIGSKIAEIYLSLMAIDRRAAKAFTLGMIAEIEADEGEGFAVGRRSVSERNGIEYEDFLSLLKAGGTFTEIFERVTRSANIFISRKQDWFDLVERLIDNGYTDIACRFIESASPLWRSDQRAAGLVLKLRAKEVAKDGAKGKMEIGTI